MCILILVFAVLLSFLGGVFVGKFKTPKEFLGIQPTYKYEFWYNSYKFRKQLFIFATSEEQAYNIFYKKAFAVDSIISFKKVE